MHILCNEIDVPDLHPEAPRRAAGADPAAHRRIRRGSARQRRSGGDDDQHDRRSRRRAAPYALRALSRRTQPLSRLLGIYDGSRPASGAEAWRSIADRRERLRTGLTAIYGWYARNASLAACVLRDAEHHALTREISDMRWGPYMAAYPDVLGEKLEHKAARDAASRAQLPHLADVATRRRLEIRATP